MDAATADFYSKNAPAVAARYESAASSISNYFAVAFSSGSRVLDIGAGSGRDLAALIRGGFDAYGVEPIAELRAQACQRHPELTERPTGWPPAAPAGAGREGIPRPKQPT